MAGNKKKDCWQANGTLNLGSTTEGTSFQADFPRSGYYTVQFDVNAPPNADVSPVPPGQLASGQLVLPRAEILWSVEGTQVRRLVNLAKGNAVSGAGQGVRVRMFDYSLLNVGSTISAYTVSAQVVRGTRPNGGGSRPPMLEVGGTLTPGPGIDRDPRGASPTLTIVAGSSGSWYVPRDAGCTTFYLEARPSTAAPPQNYVNGDFRIDQRTQFHVGAARVGEGNYDNFNQWCPLSPAANIILVTNLSAIDSFVSLYFGIEG